MEQEAGAPVADACLPDNQASGDAAPLGIGAAHWAYIRQQRRHRATCSTTTCPTWAEKNVRVLFVVQPGERNTMDQRHIEYSLRGLQAGQYGDRIAASPETGAFIEGPVWSMRASLADIHREGTIDPATGALLFRGFEISVVYFRAGYSPNDYPTEAEWAARRLMNRSTAVECPDPAFHLAGLKKAQQVWCEAGVVERLLASSRSYVQADGSPDVAAATAAAQALRQVFALQHGLDSPEATAALERDAAKYAAAESLCDDGPGDYVLKPQREGGGNNAHGAGARTTAASLPPSEKPGWILMEKIAAPHRPSVFMRHCEVLPVSETICELGIYGVMLVDESTNQVFVNRPSGYLARTKPATSGEGGVASGFSCLDSVELI
ncbi:hypothetical protein H696_04093 [Fonticula alba]|uniref:Glutathione synthetase n=1 Tax=Fonticula alba TaxID=691883 RepID=A0A058Z5Y7_FONAL|nr:hypothetical protein H696_04093 [Fonticula alba]KCV69685.1 hypothetical protein H696_04093 [Fonticula alba]|eukprot:XP_009496250.1 hypothetical protein H696_04093 [Fonticula alba]